MKKQLSALAVILILAITLTGCTTLGENAGQYFTQIGTVFEFYANSKEDDSDRLSMPENVTLDRSGTEEWHYSFASVEGAGSYRVSFVDKNNTKKGTYFSDIVEATGGGIKTGSFTAPILPYGEYALRVSAVPPEGDTEHRSSKFASDEFTLSGAVDTLAYEYFWNCFDKSLTVQVTNLAVFQSTSEPEHITVNLTNEADAAEKITAVLDKPSLSGNVYNLELTGLTPNATYQMDISAEWNESFVTNPISDVLVGSVKASDTDNIISPGFGYNHLVKSLSFDFPAVQKNFDVSNGGPAGMWYYFYSTDSADPAWGKDGWPARNIAAQMAAANGGEVKEHTEPNDGWYLTATPTETTSGSLYTYDIKAASGWDSAYADIIIAIYEYDDSFIPGKMEIYADGTFKVNLDYKFFEFNPIVNTNFEFLAKEVYGTWTQNSDGTINLNYNLSTYTVDAASGKSN